MSDSSPNKSFFLLSGFVVAFLAMVTPVILFMAMTRIGAGYVGVVTWFGKTTGQVLSPGIHFINPLKSVHKMNTRTRSISESGDIPSKEMLLMSLVATTNYHIEKDKVIGIYNTIGPDYVSTYLEPHVKSAIREVTSDYNAQDFFSAKRETISNEIKNVLDKQVTKRGFVVETVMLKEVTPPQTLRRAIENKQAQQQEAEAMQFRLQKEKLEAQRKKIEAEGIQKFQEIVKKGIDQNLLAWKGIEATEMLAKSQNAKIVIIGTEKTNGLPLVMPTK